jgi:putative sigma-54 modulation protein
MIRKLEITGVHIETDEKLKKYVQKSVAKLERYMPKHARTSAHVDVKLSESKKQQDKQCTAEIIVHLPHEKLTAKESTVNLYAAIDIVEAKLRNQIDQQVPSGEHQPGLNVKNNNRERPAIGVAFCVTDGTIMGANKQRGDT